MEKIKRQVSGGSYCKQCGICISRPRARKNYQERDFYLTCEKCEKDTLHIIFMPRHESLMVDFMVKFEDIDELIKMLNKGKNYQLLKEKENDNRK